MTPDSNIEAREIICFGEVLWDSLPTGLFAGGAPFNVARHLQMLGEPSAIVSRIGDDDLGERLLVKMADWLMSRDLIQVDPELDTGLGLAVRGAAHPGGYR